MSFSAELLSLLVLAALGLSLLTLLLVTSLRPKRRDDPTALSARERAGSTMQEHAAAIRDLRGTVRQLGEADARLREHLAATVQRVGLFRYDAFEDMGGRLSFSLALLDEGGDGVVVTAINGRQDTRVYAKPVTAGGSAHNLSEEEAEAIRQAMAGSSAARA